MRTAAKRAAKSQQADPFYSGALTAADRVVLEAAREVEGLDEEIALLRTKLRSLVASDSSDVEPLLKGVRLLVQTVAVRYRISGAAKDDLYQHVVGVLEGLGAALMPEENAGGR